ncbi:ABC transporter ATP-binding protein [Pseudorhodobacter aquimaris]|uniref:ABC transporter ATP-binding protein n=1 Tax=Pseudorhodobacter aquimaris TaxID=687412 RepID=UPI00067C6949|nr:sn-glycerol-3-phosphate ABC transporter ATP-binding protein UgpC [Pseudorhodobacter aquimaris]
MATVTLHNLVKAYGKAEVLHGINLEVADGEFVVFVGPSGCGKSTTLRIIAGLEDVTSGEVQIGGRTVNHLEPKDRDIAMVFQNYAIYPHMSVRKNIGFGLRTSSLSKPEREQRIEEVAAILSMTEYLDRKPAQLSGGQRQRVAIGRAMVRDPAVFLFDEPLSNLDAQLRSQMRLEIKKLHQRVGTTIIFVTHDQVEAMTMADRIVIMKDGHIQQIGTPAEVFHQPANIFVAQFIGAPSMNLMPGRAVAGGLEVGGTMIARETGRTGAMTVGIRPDDLCVTQDKGCFSGRITLLEPLGSETLVYVDIDGQEVVAHADGRNPPALGAVVQLTVDPANLHLFGADGEAIT